MAVKEENVAGVATICDRFTVVTSSGKEINKVRVIFKSAKDDVAIVAVPGDLGVRSRISRTVSVGQSIHTMGFPYLKGFKSPVITYSRGFISAVGIKKEQTFMGLNNLVRFSIFGYVGSSGSAVWDGAGNIVGMISLQAGFNTFSGMIPQQDSLYGAGCNALIDLYQSIGLTSLSK
jgi:S1-C subfamily serine protease